MKWKEKEKFEIYCKSHDSDKIGLVLCIKETENVVEQICDILSRANPNIDYWYGDGK